MEEHSERRVRGRAGLVHCTIRVNQGTHEFPSPDHHPNDSGKEDRCSAKTQKNKSTRPRTHGSCM